MTKSFGMCQKTFELIQESHFVINCRVNHLWSCWGSREWCWAIAFTCEHLYICWAESARLSIPRHEWSNLSPMIESTRKQLCIKPSSCSTCLPACCDKQWQLDFFNCFGVPIVLNSSWSVTIDIRPIPFGWHSVFINKATNLQWQLCQKTV